MAVLRQIFVYKVPVNQIPEGFQVVRTAVAVVDVVGVLPYVDGQYRLVRAGQRSFGIAGVGDSYGTNSLFNQPGPARTEVAGGLLIKLFLECIEGAKGLLDGFLGSTSRLTATVGAQAVPVEGVVPDLSGVVEQGAT